MTSKLKICIYLSPVLVLLVALSIGSKVIPFTEIIDIVAFKLSNKSFFTPTLDPVNMNVLLNIRLPRILLTGLVGMSLALSGATFQAILKNPLVDPYILGLSSGAAFGVGAFSLLTNLLPPQVAALVFGLLAVGISYGFASHGGETASLALVLAGVMVSYVFTALLAIVQIIIDPLRLQSLIYYTLGSFNAASWDKVQDVLPFIAVALVVVLAMGWRLNILALEDKDAQALGVHVRRDKAILIVASAVLATSAVMVAGIISLVGLIIPHIIRMRFGADNRQLLPLCMALGASYLTLVDTFSRTLFSYEVPVGIFTTLIGAPFFIFLLRRVMKG